MTENNAETTQEPSMTVRFVKKSAAFLLITVFIGAATGALHIRAAVSDESGETLLPVAATIIERQSSYDVSERYSGRIEPRQTVDLAFEQPGKLIAVNADEGDRVKEGDILATLDLDLLNAALAQAEASVERIKAQLDLSELTEERQKALFEQGHANQQRYDEARLNTVTLKAQLAEAAARAKTARINISKAVLVAPFDGRVAARFVDVGGVQPAGGRILTLLQEGQDRARFALPVQKANTLSRDRVYTATANNKPLNLRVSSVRGDVNPLTRTQDVLFDVVSSASAETDVTYGDLLELQLTETRDQVGYWTPTEALVEGSKGLWTVYAIEPADAGAIVVRRSIEVLYAEVDRVFVRANLGARAEIIASGVHRVVPGQTVEAIRRGQD